MLVYLRGTPIWGSENNSNNWNLFWLSRRLIICPEQINIYIITFPNTSASKEAKIHDILVIIIIIIIIITIIITIIIITTTIIIIIIIMIMTLFGISTKWLFICSKISSEIQSKVKINISR